MIIFIAFNFLNKRINKYYKENGYITCFAIDDCHKDNTRSGHNLTDEEMYDHQLLLCDPNKVGINTSIKRCLYGNIIFYVNILNNFGENIKIIENIPF